MENETPLQKQLRWCAEKAKTYLDVGEGRENIEKIGEILQNLSSSLKVEKPKTTDNSFVNEKEALFALKLFRHDINNDLFVIHYLSMDISQPRVKIFLLFTETIGYLATGDKNLLSDIPASVITELEPAHTSEILFEYDDIKVSADIYVALQQFIKNAINFEKTHKKKVIIKDKNDHYEFSVKDSGPGIKKEIMPKIFGDYTSKKSGGFGLQCAKKIADMRKGYIEVFSKVQNSNNGYSFNTRDKKLKPYQQKKHGTTFKLYVGK